MTATASSTAPDMAALAKAAKDQLDAHTYETIQWHFHDSTGCPFWLQKKREFNFDPLKEVQGYADIQKFPLKVRATMPAPKILSVQMNTYNVLRDEDGWWNKISPGDRENAVQELQRVARDKAQSSGMLDEARSSIEQRIREIVERNSAPVEFIYPWQER